MRNNFLVFFLCLWGGVVLRAQNISSATPSQNPVPEGSYLTVAISGNNTHFAQGSSLYVTANIGGNLIYGYPIGGLTNTTATVAFYLPCGACGTADLYVQNPYDGQMSFPNAFNVSCAQLTGTDVNTINAGQSLPIGISGTGIDFTQGSHSVYFRNTMTGQTLYPSSYNGGGVDSTNVTLSVSSMTCSGVYDVCVYPYNSGCVSCLPNALTVNGNNGQLTAVSPGTIQSGQTLPIGISGTGVDFTQGTLTVRFRNTATGQIFHASNYNAILVDSLNVDLTIPSYICSGMYDVCVYSSANYCTICLPNALSVVGSGTPQIDTVNTYSSPVGGQPLWVGISGTNVNFQQGSSLYFQLVNNTTGATVTTSQHYPSWPSSLSQTTVFFNQIPSSCGSYDLFVYGADPCGSTVLTYPNAVTVDATLNPHLNWVSRNVGQPLTLSLSGTDINFMQGSNSFGVELVNISTGATLTGSNLTSYYNNSSYATVDFNSAGADCGYYDLKIHNVPTGCGNTTTVVYPRAVGIRLRSCVISAQSLPVLSVYNGNSLGATSYWNKTTTNPQAIDAQQMATILEQENVSKLDMNVQVYPNPMDKKATVTITASQDQALTFCLYDMLGKQVMVKDLSTNATIEIERQGLPAGMYTYRVSDKAGTTMQVGKLELR